MKKEIAEIRRELQSKLKHLKGRRSGADHEIMWLFLLVSDYLIGKDTERLTEILSGTRGMESMLVVPL